MRLFIRNLAKKECVITTKSGTIVVDVSLMRFQNCIASCCYNNNGH